MGAMKRFLMDIMEEMGENEITEAVNQRAIDIMAHKAEEEINKEKSLKARQNEGEVKMKKKNADRA